MAFLPSLRQLRHLSALARTGHFGRAARDENVTQSTLSASVKALEDGLDAALVDRSTRRVVLTPLGREVAERARRIVADAEDLAQLARAEGAPLAGTLRLGVIPTIGPYLLPRVLPALRRAYPKLRLHLIEDLTDRLVDQLNQGRLDVLLLALPYDVPGTESALVSRDPFSLVAPKGHKLLDAPAVTTRALKGENLLLLREGHCMRGHALDACGLAGTREAEALEATSLHTIVQMADNGLGITLLPRLALDAGLLRGTRLAARPLEGAARDIGLVWRRGTARKAEFELLARELARLEKH